MEKGYDVDPSTNMVAPLIVACGEGNFAMAHFLLDCGAQVFPSLLPSHSLLQILIHLHSQVDDFNSQKAQPIHYTCRHNTTEAQDFLVRMITQGARQDAISDHYFNHADKSDFTGQTPLLTALFRKYNPPRLLLSL